MRNRKPKKRRFCYFFAHSVTRKSEDHRLLRIADRLLYQGVPGGLLWGTFSKLESFHQDEKRHRFEQITGNSPALEALFGGVHRGAPTTSTVSIDGEIGKGKELIAKAIHNISPRCGRAFIEVNCAAIYFDLLESELFDHEKGAFTGAIARRIGRFELADHGTLFWDEVGRCTAVLAAEATAGFAGAGV